MGSERSNIIGSHDVLHTESWSNYNESGCEVMNTLMRSDIDLFESTCSFSGKTSFSSGFQPATFIVWHPVVQVHFQVRQIY